MNIYQPEKARRSFTRCKIVLVNKCVLYRVYNFNFAHKQVLEFCVYAYVYVYVFTFGVTSKRPASCTINCSIQFSENSMCLIRT